jgi:hypothetical protein
MYTLTYGSVVDECGEAIDAWRLAGFDYTSETPDCDITPYGVFSGGTVIDYGAVEAAKRWAEMFLRTEKRLTVTGWDGFSPHLGQRRAKVCIRLIDGSTIKMLDVESHIADDMIDACESRRRRFIRHAKDSTIVGSQRYSHIAIDKIISIDVEEYVKPVYLEVDLFE